MFAVTHPIRWCFLDDPGPGGLVAQTSYFDRRPYVEQDEQGTPTYVEHHRTIGDRVREAVAAGLVVDDIVEPEWPADHDRPWGQWSPLRGKVIPGTAIFCTRKPKAMWRSGPSDREWAMHTGPRYQAGNDPDALRPALVAGVVPGGADPDGDVECHVQLVRRAHLPPHEFLDRLAFPGGDLEDELVVHLEQQP